MKAFKRFAYPYSKKGSHLKQMFAEKSGLTNSEGW